MTQWAGEPAVIVRSPPGAGKTWLVERLAIQSLARLGERVMLVTQTNQQSFDLARRLTEDFPRFTAHLFHRKGLPLPEDLADRPNLARLQDWRDLPSRPAIVIANAAKWAWVGAIAPFDLMVVDEAFQLPDHRFHAIADLARRVVLVGDPGQIPPVVNAAVERWAGDAGGPHVPAPKALLARHPKVRQVRLPVSRRLVADTAYLVQPAFYPDLPFTALSPGRRLRGAATGVAALDSLLGGVSLVMRALEEALTGPVDTDLADEVAAMVGALAGAGWTVEDESGARPLMARDIGVVCAHVSQVAAVQERLPAGCEDVLVETADRFQGLEREVMLVHHPLSGRADASAFHVEAGRLCVMLSRHRAGCVVVGRAGMGRLLREYAPSGERPLGVDEDPEFEGWRAHLALLDRLEAEGRVYSAAVLGGASRVITPHPV